MSRQLRDGTYIVVPDMQIPYEDNHATAALLGIIDDMKPDGLINVGDEADSPEPSRWSRGKAEEYAGSLWDGLIRTHNVMAQFDALAPVHHVMRSNHTDRVENYIAKYAPALVGNNNPISVESLLGYKRPSILTGDTLNVTFHRDLWEFAPGWVLAHGDEASSIRTAGGTALNLAKKIGKSVVCGHTHKAGIQHQHLGHGGKVTQHLYGVEVGNLMSQKKASYLKAGHANWQQAFAILHIEKRKVSPEIVLINNKSCVVRGKRYSW